MDGTTELPIWVTLLLVPAAAALWTWFKADGWPSLRSLWSADAKTRIEAAKQAAADREERFLAAYEQTAKALQDIAGNSAAAAQAQRESAAALRTAAETRVLDNLTLQRVERRLDAIEDVVGRQPPVVRARVRGRTEGEHGE